VSSLDSHVHFLTIAANTGGTANVHVALSGSDGLFGATSGGGGQVSTTLPHFDTNHAHNTTLAAAPVTPQHTTLTGPLPQHTHDVEKRIPTGQPSPASITMTINGQGLSSGKQATGTRNGAGAFTSSFVVTDIGPELDAFAPGTDVPIQFFAGAGAGNPNGVGYIVITITSSEELGGLTSTVRAV
jgi:hypothetical protein